MAVAMKTKIAVVGLGYVGLPVALAFAKKHTTIGFDIDGRRVEELKRGHDRTGEVTAAELKAIDWQVTDQPAALKEANFIIVAVPTPIDSGRRPNLEPLLSATRTVAQNLSPGSTIVFESTVYPGVTEDLCAPVLLELSGLSRDQFKLGYSPERINPGDKKHTFTNIIKVVSGEDEATLERVAEVYASVVEAGVFRAQSIKVAEAAKVIENTQRDINIALMNELSIIFERMDIRTCDVLAAANSKWNFLPFTPGLVGGHCIGVDPYYLTAKAEELGYHPQMILSGRRLNDNMSAFVAQKAVKMLITNDVAVKGSRIAVLGVTFKENVSDFRNSKVFPLIRELESFGIDVLVHDPLVDAELVHHHHGVKLRELDELQDLDGIVMAVSHRYYESHNDWGARLRGPGIFIDIKSVLDPATLPPQASYWSL